MRGSAAATPAPTIFPPAARISGDVLEIDFTVEDGVLKVGVGAGVKVPLKAISENVFVGVFNSQMEFVANGQGEVTHLIIHGVEGDVPGERKPAQ